LHQEAATKGVKSFSYWAPVAACLLAGVLWAAGGDLCGAEPAAPPDFEQLVSEPTVKWLPPPLKTANADARSEREMKPYTEPLCGGKVAFDMVPIRGGRFVMGSPAAEKGRKPDEGPQHEVAIEPFWMGRCEVTWDEFDLWAAQMDRVDRYTRMTAPTERDELCDALAVPSWVIEPTQGMGREHCPAVLMSQVGAKIYCKWLSVRTGRFYRLPTEAEWEYACRAGTTAAYSFGDDPGKLDQYAWHHGNSGDKYHPVGTKKPNPWGLFDMHGNVAEWVLDQHAADFYARAPRQSPLALPTKAYPRVVRGGSWDDDPALLRSAARRGSTEEWSRQDPQDPKDPLSHTESTFVGFRLVRPLRIPTAEECKRYELTPDDVRRVKEYGQANGVGG
jgi:formylglycine-generating enzyme required for sulfatase activity